MIGTYQHNTTGKEIYVQDFTAQYMGYKPAEEGEKLEKVLVKLDRKIVLYKEKGNNSFTFVMDKEIFDEEFTKVK